jgi:GTP-binding protein Era
MSEILYDDKFKSGFVAVLGKPNVGKSTLINALLGQKIASVSHRPQTTRKVQRGILTLENAQIIFIDTPGIHKPRYKLGEKMNEAATQELDGCDVILFIADVTQLPNEEDTMLAKLLAELKNPTPIILALNKIDLISEQDLSITSKAYQALNPASSVVNISATQLVGLDLLLEYIINHLPISPPLYPEDQLTDAYERDLAADLIRESCLHYLQDEIPHGVAIRIDQFTERNQHGAYIEATIFVERESHKGIVIGKGGAMIKDIGSRSRLEIEQITGRKVFLRLRVKIRKNWRNDPKMLRWLGF